MMLTFDAQLRRIRAQAVMSWSIWRCHILVSGTGSVACCVRYKYLVLWALIETLGGIGVRGMAGSQGLENGCTYWK